MFAEEEHLASVGEFFGQGRGCSLSKASVFRGDLRESHLHGVLDLLVCVLEVLDERAVVQTLEAYNTLSISR
jgi:hypothetical protein